MSSEKKNDGVRYSKGKIRYDLIPPEAKLFLSRVLTQGSYKYEERNWEKGMKWSECLRALQSHLTKWEMGAMYDEESGEPHLAHVMWNAMALLVYEQRDIGVDDRPACAYTLDVIEDLHLLPREEPIPPHGVDYAAPGSEYNLLSYLSEEEAPSEAVPEPEGEGVASSIAACAHCYRVPPSPNSEYSAAWCCTTPGCCGNTSPKP